MKILSYNTYQFCSESRKFPLFYCKGHFRDLKNVTLLHDENTNSCNTLVRCIFHTRFPKMVPPLVKKVYINAINLLFLILHTKWGIEGPQKCNTFCMMKIHFYYLYMCAPSTTSLEFDEI